MNQNTDVKKKYRQYVKENNLSLFYQPWYLDAVCYAHEWGVVLATRDNKAVGVWPYFQKKKNGLTTITQPILTPYLGPHIVKQNQTDKLSTQLSYEKKILTELSNQLPKVNRLVVQGHPEWTNWQPLSWLGYEQTTRYTYQINLTKTETELYDALSDKTRNQIKTAKQSLRIEETTSSAELIGLVKATYKRQGISTPFSNKQFEVLHCALTENDSFKAYMALYENDKVAVVYSVYDKETTYLLITGQSDKKVSGSVSYLIWHSILEARRRGSSTFDFEGSMIEGVESFFRSFGGNQTPYHRLTKASNKPLYMLFKLLGKI